MEDPIAVPITKLEQDKYGNPKDFSLVVKEMLEGNDGKIKIENANRLLPKVKLKIIHDLGFNFFIKRIPYLIYIEKCSTSYLLLRKSKGFRLLFCIQFIRHRYGSIRSIIYNLCVRMVFIL
jgi:hypothetical protein